MSGRRDSSFTIAVVLLTTSFGTGAAAAPPEWALQDYVRTVWTHREGVPLVPIEIVQTADGYLWFISQREVIRFDGIRFATVTVPCERVYALEQGDNGSLWVLCHDAESKLLRRAPDGQITALPVPSREGHLRDRHGRLWIYGKGLGRVESDGTFHDFPWNAGDTINSAAEDVDGTMWLATNSGVIHMMDDQIERLPIGRVRGLAPAPTGGVFACQPRIGIRHMVGAAEKALVHPPPDGDFMCTGHAMALDAAGGFWATTRQHGIALIQDGRVETSLTAGELSGFTTDVFVDREQNVWVGSTTGLHRFRKPLARMLSSVVALPPQPLLVFADPRDEIWVGSGTRLARVNPAGGPSQVFTSPPYYHALASDDADRVWVATDTNVGFVRGPTIVPVTDATGAAIPKVTQFGTDTNGHLWAVAERVGLYQVTPGPPRLMVAEPLAASDLLISSQHGTWVTLAGGGVKQFVAGRDPVVHDTEGGAEIGSVLTLADGGDSIWAGDRGGLLRWRNGVLTRWTRAHGLPDTGQVHEMAIDRTGRLWLMTSAGIVVVSRADLDATADGAPRSLRFAQIGVFDRVVPHAGPPRLSPRISVASDGRLYFATVDSVAIVDPATVVESALRPSILLEALFADNEPVNLTTRRRFTAPSRLRFEYTSLSLRSPEHARFRYRLEGHDADWIEAGTERHVTYGTLPPGQYRFHVIGSGSEGVWNEEGATVSFEIVPLFWDTWWFRLALTATIVSAIGSVAHLRWRRMTRQMQMRFDERLAERTRVARELHDTLLQTVQGSKLVADHALKDSADHDRLVRALEQLSTWLAQATEEGRAALQALRASVTETNNLAEAFRRAIEECRIDSTTQIIFSVKGRARELHPVVRDELYRIGYEAIRNGCVHSRGNRIDVQLEYGSELKWRISDDGVGIDAETLAKGKEGHFGLRGMKERAERIGARFTLESTSGAGTVITLVLPGRTAFRQPHQS